MNTLSIVNFVSKLFLFSLLMITQLSAQTTANFEGITGQDLTATPDCRYFDANTTSAHQLQNFNTVGGCGIITVLSPGAGSTLGFEVTLDPLGANGGDGFSDGDAVGVATNASLMFELGANAPEGVQGFIFEDTDGEVDMIFDQVDLTGTSTPMVSLQYFLSTGSWETVDYLYVHVDISGCAAATSVSLIDTRGFDINDLGLDGSWNTLSANLTPYVGCKARLIIEHSSNSAAEELGIDIINFTEGTVLPVSLVAFDAKSEKETIRLDWKTAAETNNKGFEVQHSTNAREWAVLDFIEGEGTSSQFNQYSFVDHKPKLGENYYRLKQIDYDGAFEISAIKKVNWRKYFNSSILELSIAPNPTSKWLNISLPKGLTEKNKLTIQIYNQLGQLAQNQQKEIIDKAIHLEVDELPEGLYVLEIVEKGLIYTARFVKY